MSEDKVVFVDFRKHRRPSSGGFGGGPRLLFAVFGGVLALELLVVAIARPEVITSAFFGPTVIAVAVLATLGARRIIARGQIAWLHKKHTREATSRPDERTGRWLH